MGIRYTTVPMLKNAFILAIFMQSILDKLYDKTRDDAISEILEYPQLFGDTQDEFNTKVDKFSDFSIFS